MLRSDLCDYSDAYIVVKGIIIFVLDVELIILEVEKIGH